MVDLLHKMGFPSLFVEWIKTCITSFKFSVNINGESVGFFSSSRGLRQGDPISSYLFVIAMETLSMLINKRVGEHQTFAFHWRCNLTRTTHLSFADDLMLFCGDSVESASTLKKALTDFSLASGLHPNESKSCIFIAGSDERYKQAVLNIFRFPLGSLPIKYLGIPLITTRLMYGDCLPMIESITMRIKSWTTKILSYAGRVQLIQSVMFGVQEFWASILYLPKRVLQKVEQIIRAFLWKGPEMSNGGAKVEWEELTKPKSKGGLGIKKLEDWNTASLAKHLWNICKHNPTSNWAAWARANLLRGRSIWDIISR